MDEMELKKELNKIFPYMNVESISKNLDNYYLVNFKGKHLTFKLKELQKYAKLIGVKNVGIKVKGVCGDGEVMFRLYPSPTVTEKMEKYNK